MANIVLDEKAQKTVRYYIPENKMVSEIADFFSVFCDETRIKILSALSITEMCVTDLASTLELNQSTLSHQLKYLRHLGMVKYRRDGKVIYYSLTNNCVNDILNISLNYLK